MTIPSGGGGVVSDAPSNSFFLQGLNAPDLGLLVNNKDFAVIQDMTEEFRQDVTYSGGFGVDGPITRTVRYADDGTISFTAVLLKNPTSPLKNEDDLKYIRDFEIATHKGDGNVHTYSGCNWTSLTIRSTLDGVTFDATISVPGLARQQH